MNRWIDCILFKQTTWIKTQKIEKKVRRGKVLHNAISLIVWPNIVFGTQGHTLGIRLQVIRKELISIGEITKQFNCERSVAEWYYDRAGKKKKRAIRMLQNAIELERRLSRLPECVICNEFMMREGDNSPGGKYCSNRQCKAQQCQGSICKNCVQRLEKCPWCRKW